MSHEPSYPGHHLFLRQGLQLNLELENSASMAGQLQQGSVSLCLFVFESMCAPLCLEYMDACTHFPYAIHANAFNG